jgi:hypothetical protein
MSKRVRYLERKQQRLERNRRRLNQHRSPVQYFSPEELAKLDQIVRVVVRRDLLAP